MSTEPLPYSAGIIKVYLEDEENPASLISILTTQDEVRMVLRFKNESDVVARSINYLPPNNMRFVDPIQKLPDVLNPQEEFKASVIIDTSISQEQEFQVTASFLSIKSEQ